jgi:hypothetical protein
MCHALQGRNSTHLQGLFCMWTHLAEIFTILSWKKSYKTRIYGLDYANFLSEYNMKHGDQLRLDMNNKPPYMFMHPLDKYGYEKERVLGMVF